MLLVFKLNGHGGEHIVAVVDDARVLLNGVELLFHHAQLVLVVGLLLLGFLKLQRLRRQSLRVTKCTVRSRDENSFQNLLF